MIATENFESNYKSTVMVFDISINTDLVATIDKVIMSVKPIFEYEYIGLKSSVSILKINGYSLSYGISENRVIPYPTVMNGQSLAYDLPSKYYLKDISYGASLYNEQELNRTDVGYNPYNDVGSYFTGYDYTYKGKYTEYGEFPTEDILWAIGDMASMILGCFDAIPFVGTITATIGTIYDYATLGNSLINIGKDIYYNVNGYAAEVESGELSATSFYNNRDDQLAFYKDKDNKPYMVKTAAIAINTSAEKSMWYGKDDNTTAYFSIGHSALNGQKPNYTRLMREIALKVVDSSQREVKTASSYYEYYLREKVVKPLGLNRTIFANILPSGQNYFIFTPKYNGQYTFYTKGNKYIKVELRGIPLSE